MEEFYCKGCKQMKPLSEAVMLLTEPETTQTTEGDRILVEVTRKLAVICRDCEIRRKCKE